MKTQHSRFSAPTLLAAVLASLSGCSAAGVDGEVGTDEEAVMAGAPVLPSAFDIARALDLKCAETAGPPPVGQLHVRQLNPVLAGVLPDQLVKLEGMVQTCTPVSKNNVIPPPAVLPFERGLKLACYRASADPVNVPVTLSHLNPVLKNLPDEDVVLRRAEKFCTAVTDDPQMPDVVKRVAKAVDFVCYQFDQPTSDVNKPLLLRDLDPAHAAFPVQHTRLHRATQLCVPVAKNQEVIPQDVLRIVRWLDLLDYPIDVPANEVVPWNALLKDLNPLFAQVPPTPVWFTAPTRLLVPVAKDGILPPKN